MYAPPPVQRPRKEVEGLFAQLRRRSSEKKAAKLEAKAAKNEAKSEKKSPKNEAKSPSLLQKSSSKSPPSPRGKTSQSSSPPSSVPSSPPSGRENQSKIPTIARGGAENVYTLSPGFGEHPRRAPSPPRRHAERSNQSWPLATPKVPPKYAIPDNVSDVSTAPPIPSKSPRRQPVADLKVVKPFSLDSVTTAAPPNSGTARHLSNRETRSKHAEKPSVAPRASTAPPSIEQGRIPIPTRTSSVKKTKEASHPSSSRHSEKEHRSSHPSERERRSSQVKDTRAESTSSRFSSVYQAAMYHQPEANSSGSSYSNPDYVGSGRSTRREERPSRSQIQSLSSPTRFLNKELPATPPSISHTPTEMYHNVEGSRRHLPTNPKSSSRRSSIQHPKPEARDNTSMPPDLDLLARKLAAYPEYSEVYERSPKTSPKSSGASTPATRRIQLRDGSVLTVTPPETAPWQRAVYTQGPIQLQKPANAPSKDAVANLDSFRELIDSRYQQALPVPRRRSDDQAEDDVCDFFDGYGFSKTSYQGDAFVSPQMRLQGLPQLTSIVDEEIERYSTPPTEPLVSPIRRSASKHSAQVKTAQASWQNPSVSPLITKEAVRTNGIASPTRTGAPNAKHHYRQDSATFFPLPVPGAYPDGNESAGYPTMQTRLGSEGLGFGDGRRKSVRFTEYSIPSSKLPLMGKGGFFARATALV